MTEKSLVEESKDLNGIALEAFILDCTSQGQNRNYYELFSHPNIRSVKPRFTAIVELFGKGGALQYEKFCNSHERLNEKQVATFKKLILLSEFKGKHTVFITYLQKKLECSEEQLFDILLEMSINGQITIKIDELKGVISLLYSELRNSPIENKDSQFMTAKIKEISSKNENVANKIREIKEFSGFSSKAESRFDFD